MKKNNSVFIVLCFVSFIILIAAYSNHFHNAFHFDDHHIIVDNLFIRDIKNIPLFFMDARSHSSLPANQTYRPLTSATLAVDYWLGNGVKSTFYFHLSTFIWYVAQCVLLYFFFLKIITSAVTHRWNKYIALFGVSWYGLHTANAETINYIYQRADSLSTFMVVAGFVLYAYLPKWRNWYVYLIPIIVGMFIKEPTAMFAPLLFFYIMFFEKKRSLYEGFKPINLMDIIKKSLPALMVCIILAIFVVKMQSSTWTPGGTSRSSYFITQPFVILRYFTTFFLPVDLSADADWKVFNNFFDVKVIAGFLFTSIMLFIAYITSRKQETRPVSYGILWFFIALIPTSSFVPLAEVMNDHRMFFPFIGLMLAVCWTLGFFIIKSEQTLLKKPFVGAAVLIVLMVILAGHAYGTYQRNRVWRTEESLWYDVTIKSPGNGRGLMNYGLTQMGKGDYVKASEYFEKALTLTPHYSYLHVNLGILKGAMNQPAEAERYFNNALLYDPNNPEGYYYYAKWLYGRNRNDEAVPLLQRALQLSPGHGSAQSLLNELLSRANRLAGAEQRIMKTAKTGTTAEYYLDLSLQYHNAGRYQDSVDACKEALKIKPHYDLAYNNICAAYNELKMWDKAIEACEKGVRINPDNQLLKNNLARAKEQKKASAEKSPKR